MSGRPIYLGTGECDCGRIDVLLYRPPGSILSARPVCPHCLLARGHRIPKARTADDLVLDEKGKPSWKEGMEEEPLVHVGKLELGHGHIFETVLGSDERLVGWLHTHPDKRNLNVLCQSFCAVRPLNGAPIHQVLCAEPLSLSPSLLCRTCGAHGNVTNAKWEPLT